MHTKNAEETESEDAMKISLIKGKLAKERKVKMRIQANQIS